jgi:multisubunit Na+/H+ antiporter MnhB subunit
MRVGYSLKLAFFLLLAACGGVIGAAMGTVVVLSLIAPLIIVGFGRLTEGTNLPQSTAVFAGYLVVGSSFVWATLKSYTYLIRRFW